jgi:hypothetical protein
MATAAAALLLSLHAVARVPTHGAAGFEVFRSPSTGRTLLATANFWNGKDAHMFANSTLHALGPAPPGQEGLALTLLQTYLSQGAHGFDFFRAGGEAFLVLCNYYGCGAERGPAGEGCTSTVVLRHAGGADDAFMEHQRLPTAGPAQTAHLSTSSGATYLLVGENFNDQVCAWRYDAGPQHFMKDSCVPVPGAGAMAVAELGGHVYLVAASYHNGGWATSTPVFRAPLPQAHAQPLAWALHQALPTHGAHDAELATFAGTAYLFLAEDRSDATTRITSSLYTLDAATQRFELLQRIPTDGAHGGEFFAFTGGVPCLAVANFGDRLGKRYAARSSVWCRGGGVEGGAFERATEVRTQGATDARHWEEGGRHFLAIAEEGDLERRAFQRSSIFEVRAVVGGGGEGGGGHAAEL